MAAPLTVEKASLRYQSARRNLDIAAANLRAALEREVEAISEHIPAAVQKIMETVAHEYGVTVRDILSRVRTAELVEARHMAMHLARVFTKFNLQALGRHFCRNHSTIMHAQHSLASRKDTDPKFAARLERVVALLRFPSP